MVDLSKRLEERREEYQSEINELRKISEDITDIIFDPENEFVNWNEQKKEINKLVKKAEIVFERKKIAEARYYELYWAMTGEDQLENE